MANTHHCRSKDGARKLAHRLRKRGNCVSVNKLKHGWSVTAWKK
jgi:hypothetical protein